RPPGTLRMLSALAALAAVGVAAGFWAYPWVARSTASADAIWAQAEQDLVDKRYDRVARAIELLSKTRQPSPPDYLLRAQYAEARQDPDTALANLRQGPDGHYMATQARFLAGQIELRRDCVRRAEELFLSAIRLDRKLVSAHRRLIYIYGMQLRRAEISAQFRALADLVPLTPDNVFHWCLLRNNSWEP